MAGIRIVRTCKECREKGVVVESRERDGVIYRRLRCANGHRFTTIELQPALSSGGKRALTDPLREMAS